MRRRAAVALAALALVGALATGCSEADTAQIPEPTNLAQETAVAYVYFATGRSLVEEERVIDASKPYDDVIRELLEAKPERNQKIAIVQPEAEVLSTSLDDQGVLTIDWNRAVLAFEAEDREELIALASILRTMGQFEEVKKVKFTVEGKTSGEIGGRDIAAFWGDVNLKAQPWDVLRPQPRTQDETATPGGAPGESTQTPGGMPPASGGG